ncbi:hypothetical protein DS739_00830 [Acetobacter sp. JWB]|nr:hypothetical protein CPF11_06590 [Acetobacter pomorum]AXC25480.1 hypothetical protein DS739_00830 [Acetobacter sp. JWB]
MKILYLKTKHTKFLQNKFNKNIDCILFYKEFLNFIILLSVFQKIFKTDLPHWNKSFHACKNLGSLS